MMNISNPNNTNIDVNGVSRRSFMKLSGIMASGLMMPSSTWASTVLSPNANRTTGTAQYFTPIFLQNSAARLARGSSFINAGLKHCLQPDLHTITPGNAFTLGAQMPFELGQLVDSLINFNDQWSSGEQDKLMAGRLSLLSGAITYKVMMEELKPANKFTATTPSGNEEHKIYQDSTLISHYLTKGKAMNVDEMPVLHSLLRQIPPRTFVRFHTVMPDEADGSAWVMNIAKWRNQLDMYFGELSEVISYPEPSKMKKYIEDVQFMKGGELILTKVSTFTRVANIDREEAVNHMRHESNSSACAKTLANGYQALISISDFLGSSIDKNTLKSRLSL